MDSGRTVVAQTGNNAAVQHRVETETVSYVFLAAMAGLDSGFVVKYFDDGGVDDDIVIHNRWVIGRLFLRESLAREGQ